MDAVSPKSAVVPFSLKDAPSLIERVWPAQKISVEAQKERKAGQGQTLTSLGSYWKGRKPLFLAEACLWGALLPATGDDAADLDILELILGMTDGQVVDRVKNGPTIDQVRKYATPRGSLGFFQRNNPVVRHVVLRKRSTLEEMGLIPRIPVDIHPLPGAHMPPMFDGVGLRTSSAFDAAYQAAEKFTRALSKRKKSAGFMRSLMLQRLCSSYASGLATAEKLLSGRTLDDEEMELELGEEHLDFVDEEVRQLQAIIDVLSPHPTDPKLDTVLYYLLERPDPWLPKGCIVFSQYFDTAEWVGEALTQRIPGEPIAVYAGAGKSGMYISGEWKSVEREQIKKAVKERTIRLVVATDAACEGLNLQTLGTLINIDLPWNPSRLEQRIGRIKRFGQRRDRVDMLNLLYHGVAQQTVDEKVYAKLSERMRNRFDIFGTLPDVIDDDWIEDEEKLDERLREYTERRKRANAFDLRYAGDVTPKGERWELCEKVLARHDVKQRLSRGWGERERAEPSVPA